MTTFSPEDYGALLSVLDQTTIVSIADAKGTITYANDKFVEVAKYSREELIGQNHRILKSGQQPQAMFDELWKTISSGKVWRGEIKNKAKDGTYYWVDTSIAPIMNAANKPERYIAVRFLITDKKEGEENLKNQNIELEKTKKAMAVLLEGISAEKEKYKKQSTETEKFALAVKGTSEHVIITDANGIVLYANPASERTTGYSLPEIMGTKAGKLWGGLMDQAFYVELWKTIKTDKKSFSGEITNRRKNGQEYRAFSIISPLLDQNGNVEFFVGLERDITKEKMVDKAKTEFVSLASHQLRTPLTAVSWYTEMMLHGDVGPVAPAQKKYLKEIYQGNQRMIELVDTLLDVSRIELGTFKTEAKPTDVLALTKSILDEQKQNIEEKKLVVTEHFDSDIPTVQTDPNLLRMVFQNLLTNAVKYTPQGGGIEYALAFNDTQKMLSIKISDTGYGIPESQQGQIFTKLFRADNVRAKDTDGTGLGLYIVKSVVENLGGKVWFESVENKGSTFYVTLPLINS